MSILLRLSATRASSLNKRIFYLKRGTYLERIGTFNSLSSSDCPYSTRCLSAMSNTHLLRSLTIGPIHNTNKDTSTNVKNTGCRNSKSRSFASQAHVSNKIVGSEDSESGAQYVDWWLAHLSGERSDVQTISASEAHYVDWWVRQSDSEWWYDTGGEHRCVDMETSAIRVENNVQKPAVNLIEDKQDNCDKNVIAEDNNSFILSSSILETMHAMPTTENSAPNTDISDISHTNVQSKKASQLLQDEMHLFASQFKDRRNQLGKTTKEVGATIGKSAASIHQFESWKMNMAKMEKIQPLLKAWMNEANCDTSHPKIDETGSKLSESEMREFVKQFKQRRVELGISQSKLQKMIGAPYQLSRAESFRYPLKKIQEMYPFLKKWLDDDVTSLPKIQKETSTKKTSNHRSKRFKDLGIPQEVSNLKQYVQDTSYETLKTQSNHIRKLYPSIQKGSGQSSFVKKDHKKRSVDYNKMVKSFVSSCIQADMLSSAQNYITRCAAEVNSSRVLHITDPAIYDLLIQACARQGDMAAIRQLWQIMAQNDVSATFTAHIHTLQCQGRQHNAVPSVTQTLLSEIARAGFDLRAAPAQCRLYEGEWQYILDAIHSVQPDYEPAMDCVRAPYQCELMKPLNQSASGHIPNQYQGVLDYPTLQKKAEIQAKLECDGSMAIASVTALPQQHPKQSGKPNPAGYEALTKDWREALCTAVDWEVSILYDKSKRADLLSIYPYLAMLTPQAITDILMQEISFLATDGQAMEMGLNWLYTDLGMKVLRQCAIEERKKSGFVDQTVNIYKDYLSMYNAPSLHGQNYRQLWSDIEARQRAAAGVNPEPVMDTRNRHMALHLGKALYQLLLKTVMMPGLHGKKDMPAFYRHLGAKGDMPAYFIRPHHRLVSLYQGKEVSIDFSLQDLPSLVPPPPWTALNKGGSFLHLIDLVKNKRADYNDHLKDVPGEKLQPVLDAINAVSAMPWRVNKKLLNIIIDVFRQGGNKKLEVARPSSVIVDPPPINMDVLNNDQLKLAKIECAKINKEKRELYSLWMTERYRLSIAKHFEDEVFWFPHNIDFRGRSYPVPPHFNHLGGDIPRSFLQFALGAPLGADGLDWLKIHLINLSGTKKRSSNAERLAYANTILDEILDSADRPLDGSGWWQDADEPWQCLACCMEVAQATRSPDPAKYMSHFPVHQDGSCNGLQHYAALARDQSGAESVNLAPFDAPNDVYSDVVELLEVERKKDAALGNKVAQSLEGIVKRKIIKQTIMTTVYGVTMYGALQQIRGQLQDLTDIPDKEIAEDASYLAQKTFYCLEKMFTQTKAIQEWLNLCAEHTTALTGSPMTWTTPIGFPVVQPYYSDQRFYWTDNHVLKPVKKSKSDRPKKDRILQCEVASVRRQKNGYAPNFVHSLDATHMMLTANYCLREGITFVSVHDCFWTHASQVNDMNRITREQFVALHRQPILENLSDDILKIIQFETHSESNQDLLVEYCRQIIGKVPETGSFDLDNVLTSTYFFN